MLIFFVYYGLPALGLNLTNLTAAVVALTVFTTAQVIEIARGAIQSIHHGQTEAGKAIGLGFGQRIVYVILPQALRRFLPPWINSVTDAVKGSALVSLVGIVDLMLAIQQVIGRIYEPLPLYLLGAVIYFAINYSLSSLSAAGSRRASPTSGSDRHGRARSPSSASAASASPSATNRVLKGVDLDVARGEVVTIIGPSGSGKTTLLRCINLLETYDEGTIQLDGVEVGYREASGRPHAAAASASWRRSAPRPAWSSRCSICSRT